MRKPRPLRGKKLLVASAGVGTLTLVFCGLFPGCNLMAPSCPDDGVCDVFNDDLSVVDHSAAVADLSKQD